MTALPYFVSELSFLFAGMYEMALRIEMGE
jgi:hypothetical protein